MGSSSYPWAPNKSFKPNLLRCSKSVAGKACHAFASTTQVGLTQVLGALVVMSLSVVGSSMRRAFNTWICARLVMASATLRLHASRLRPVTDAQPALSISGAGGPVHRIPGVLFGWSCLGSVARLSSVRYSVLGSSRYPGAPNNSFKPSPHRYRFLCDALRGGPA